MGNISAGFAHFFGNRIEMTRNNWPSFFCHFRCFGAHFAR